jgi:hypothetical protein
LSASSTVVVIRTGSCPSTQTSSFQRNVWLDSEIACASQRPQRTRSGTDTRSSPGPSVGRPVCSSRNSTEPCIPTTRSGVVVPGLRVTSRTPRRYDARPVPTASWSKCHARSATVVTDRRLHRRRHRLSMKSWPNRSSFSRIRVPPILTIP